MKESTVRVMTKRKNVSKEEETDFEKKKKISPFISNPNNHNNKLHSFIPSFSFIVHAILYIVRCSFSLFQFSFSFFFFNYNKKKEGKIVIW